MEALYGSENEENVVLERFPSFPVTTKCRNVAESERRECRRQRLNSS